jgi:hypothetical protein
MGSWFPQKLPGLDRRFDHVAQGLSDAHEKEKMAESMHFDAVVKQDIFSSKCMRCTRNFTLS